MDLTFTQEDVRLHLEELGYKNIPEEKLASFLKDLRRLIKHEEKKKRIDDKLSQLENSSRPPEPKAGERRPSDKLSSGRLPLESSSSYDQGEATASPRKIRRVKRVSETSATDGRQRKEATEKKKTRRSGLPQRRYQSF